MRKIIPAVAAGATALVLAGGTFAYASLDKAVSLSIDGDVSQVRTLAPTVGDLLEKQGIEVGEHDVVAPGTDTRLAEGTVVAVRYGRLVTVTVDGAEQQLWTTATSVERAIGELGIDTEGADIEPAVDTEVPRDGIEVEVATAKTVTILTAGRKQNLTTTAPTVAGALAAAKIKPDRDDKLSVPASTKLVDGTTVRYVNVTEAEVSEKVSVAYETVRRASSSLDKGDTKVDREGAKGVRTIVYRVVRHDGRTVSKKQASAQITTKPVSRVVLVGTREPAPEPEPKDTDDTTSSRSRGGSTPSASVPSGSVWDRLAECESGGNWSINTGNGYYGGLQFLVSTWRAYGGRGYPHENSREQQIAIAKKLQAAAGWGQWPACSSKLGLR